MLVICTLFCLSANVGASLQYVNTNTIVVRLTFTNDKAYCEASITGKSGTTSITNGSVVLRDNNGSVVKRGAVYQRQALYLLFQNPQVVYLLGKHIL